MLAQPGRCQLAVGAMTWRVKITRIRYQGTATCETCGAVPCDATRERCRQHADRNPGHEVRFIVEDATTYRRPPDPPPWPPPPPLAPAGGGGDP